MHETLRLIVEELADARRELFDSFARATQDELDRRPKDNGWSAGEVLHHIARTEHGIAIMLARGVKRAKDGGMQRLEDAPTRPTRLDGIGIESGAHPSLSPPVGQPTHGKSRSDLIAALERSRTSLLEALESAEDYDIRALKFTHAVLGDLDPYEWLVFVAKHDARHQAQIERALTRRARDNQTAERAQP